MSRAAIACVVYVVDADASVREGLSRLVDSAGLEAKPCASVEAFVREPPGGIPACALIDVSRPSFSDPALRARLRATAKAIPVIALSARDDPAAGRIARELGARAFFRKPVDAAALLDSIDWVMQRGANPD